MILAIKKKQKKPRAVTDQFHFGTNKTKTNIPLV